MLPSQTSYQQAPARRPAPALLQSTVALVRGALEHALLDPAQQRHGQRRAEPPTWSVSLTAPLGAIIVCETVERSLTTVLDLPALGALTPAVELAVRVIVTEAVTNVVRHAWATECVVRVRPLRGLRLEVIDDGRGLPPIYRARSGLQAIADQVQQLRGHWQIGPEVGGGTRLAAWLPASA